LKVRLIRIGAYATMLVAVALAIRFSPQLPDRRPAELLIQQAAVPSWALRVDTLGRGETLVRVLQRAGLTDSVANAIVSASTAAGLNHRALPARMGVSLRSVHADSVPSEVRLNLSLDSLLVVRREGAAWVGGFERIPWTTDTIIVSGVIRSNLYQAIDESVGDALPRAAREDLAGDVAEVFEYRVDMSRDLQKGDEFRVLAERSLGPNGAVRMGRVLASSFSLSGSITKAVRFASNSVSGDFFDQEGKSMRAAFLRAPLDFRRISSVFGSRRHPVLGDVRMHKGTDYAAASGTPVRAIGDGTVIRAGWGNGYGNVVEIRHPNGFVTRYGHLRGFARGIRAGVRVSIGETVAYVGSTGLSTGPHLHFEVLVNGQQRDPRTAFRRAGGDPIPSVELAAFAAQRDQLLATLDGAGAAVQQTSVK
jgi:murein DD-endopeptidase MepM/ murein hydrolase activator NlpD